jgi:hypothetical protein
MRTVICLPVFLLVLLAACGSEQGGTTTYTFKGDVMVINNCNLSQEELPDRVKVSYSLGDAGSGEQLVDLLQLDNESRTGRFSITIAARTEAVSYKASATRPNGKSICIQLPCPSPYGCREKRTAAEISLKTGVTEVIDTVKVICGCEL